MRPANRPFFGPQLPLRAILFAAALLPLGAHADVFGSGQSGDLAKRLQQLEQTVTELKNVAQTLTPGGPQGPGLTAPPPPPELAESEFAAPEGYVVLAEVNGRTLLREGERRLLLTPEEFHRYKEDAQRKAAAEKAKTAAVAPGAPGLNTPPPPPPLAATAQGKAVDSAMEKSGPRPVTPKTTKPANSK